MEKYTKAPGMTEFAYNSWLGKIHKRLNDRAKSAVLNRDGDNTKYKGPASEWWLSSMVRLKKEPVLCQECDLFIYKNKMINRDPLLKPLLKPCKIFTGFGIITINKKQHYKIAK